MSYAFIYHSKDTFNSFFYRKEGKIWNMKNAFDGLEKMFLLQLDAPYQLAGIVQADDLEGAYHLSQNLYYEWNKEKPCRSTSVGDIIMFQGDFYVVASCGFDKIGEDYF